MPHARPDGDEGLKAVLDGMNGLLMHRVRLGICVLLTRHSALSFSRLKELLEETDGSLGAQLRGLEEGGFIVSKKEFRNRRPVTWYSLTAEGRKRLEKHLEALTHMIGGCEPIDRTR